MVKIKDDVIRAYALKNAIEHDGKAIAGSVINSLFVEGLKRDKIKDYSVKVSMIVNDVNKFGLETQRQELKKIEKLISHRDVKKEGELPELPNAKKGVVMRFSPSPSGALHIGHAITACLNYAFVRKYKGKFYVRIEDTNPDNIYPEAYDLIKKDSDFLFKKKAKIVIQSDRLKIYYKYIEKLIKKDAVYVCTCNPEEFKKLIEKKRPCPCRDDGIEGTMHKWKKMLDDKGFKTGEAVMRFKSDIKHKNPAMRDFPIARINTNEHPKQGNKFRVWPLMNLAVAIDDIEMKMTHIIRAKEHKDNAKRQEMIYEVLGKKYPWHAYLGRYHFINLELSASKITQGIKQGKYKGWDDPRLPTIASLKKKGYKPEAFWKFAEHRGISEVDKVMKQKDLFDLLDKFNQ